MHLKSKKHVLNLMGVAAVGCELEVVWLFYNRLRSAGEHLLCYYTLLCYSLLETTLSAAHSAICMVALRDSSTGPPRYIQQRSGEFVSIIFKLHVTIEVELSNLLVLLGLPAPVAIQLSLIL